MDYTKYSDGSPVLTTEALCFFMTFSKFIHVSLSSKDRKPYNFIYLKFFYFFRFSASVDDLRKNVGQLANLFEKENLKIKLIVVQSSDYFIIFHVLRSYILWD